MKKWIMLLLLLTGCSSEPNHELKTVVRSALRYGDTIYRIELAGCDDPNDCPRAERIKKAVDIGSQFYLTLDEPLGNCGTVLAGLHIVNDLIVEDGDEQAALYMALIQTIIEDSCGGE